MRKDFGEQFSESGLRGNEWSERGEGGEMKLYEFRKKEDRKSFR
jgi:hypothetical protein